MKMMKKSFEALRAGASGYILKKTEPHKLLEAINELHEGGAPMSSQIARKVVFAFQNKPFGKSRSHRTVIKPGKNKSWKLSRGLMYKEIAQPFYQPGNS